MLENYSSHDNLEEKLIILEERNEKFREIWQKLLTNMKSEHHIDQRFSRSVQSILKCLNKDKQSELYEKVHQEKSPTPEEKPKHITMASLNQPEICFRCESILKNLSIATDKVTDLDKDLNFGRLINCFKMGSFESCNEINPQDDFLHSILKEIDNVDWSNNEEKKAARNQVKKVSKLSKVASYKEGSNKTAADLQNIIDKFRNEPLSHCKSKSDLGGSNSSSTLTTIRNVNTSQINLSVEESQSKELQSVECMSSFDRVSKPADEDSRVLKNRSVNMQFNYKVPRKTTSTSIIAEKSKEKLKIECFSTLTFSLKSDTISKEVPSRISESASKSTLNVLKLEDSESIFEKDYSMSSAIESDTNEVFESKPFSDLFFDTSNCLPEIVSLAKKMKLDIEPDVLQKITNPIAFLQSQLQFRSKKIEKERLKVLTDLRDFCEKNLINTHKFNMDSVPDVMKLLETHIDELKTEKQQLSKQFYFFNVSESSLTKIPNGKTSEPIENAEQTAENEVKSQTECKVLEELDSDLNKRVQLLKEVKNLITDDEEKSVSEKSEKPKRTIKEVKFFTCRKRYVHILPRKSKMELRKSSIKIGKEKILNEPSASKKVLKLTH